MSNEKIIYNPVGDSWQIHLLRRAAKKVREFAEDASMGPWKFVDLNPDDVWMPYDGEVVIENCPDGYYDGIAKLASAGDAKHIAMWNPAIALFVADWLESEASRTERKNNDIGRGFFPDRSAIELSLAILGEVEEPDEIDPELERYLLGLGEEND